MSIQTLVEYLCFDRYMRKVAQTTIKRGGVTAHIGTRRFLAPIDAWHFPKYPARTAILPPTTPLVPALKQFICLNAFAWLEPDCWLGTWINPLTHCYYLDITTFCADLSEARRIASESSAREGRAIVALYNTLRNQTVYL